MKPVLPRLLRLNQAITYLGMSRSVFNATVRPYLPEVRIGVQGVAFDRLDLDRWIEDNRAYKTTSWARWIDGNSAHPTTGDTWARKNLPACASVAKSGISSKPSTVSDFKKALERATCRKLSST